MTCDESKNLLSEYWSHSLGEAQELAFESHLAVCDACRAEAERLGDLWRGLALIPAEEPSANLRSRFYESLGAYRQGLESAPKRSWRDKLAAFWPKQPVWQMATSFAMLAIGVGVGLGVGRGMHPATVTQNEGSEVAQLRSEVAQLHGEASSMRQMVALSLMQQQSAGERLRGVSYAYQAAPSDTEVLSALLMTMNHDPSVNVRLAAVDALHAFGASSVTRTAIVQSIRKQTTPLVQIALIDLLGDLKVKDAAPELLAVAADKEIDTNVRARATAVAEKLK